MCEGIKFATIVKPSYKLAQCTLRFDLLTTEATICFMQVKDGKQMVLTVTCSKELLHNDCLIECEISMKMRK